MNREKKRILLNNQRESLIKELKNVYKDAFDQLSRIDIEEGSIAKLSQAFLLSRQAAISHLEKEVEKPIITRAENNDEDIK